MELGCCGCRALASEVMIYCFASFDNWQMETTRCRAREGGKFLSIRTPLTFTRKQRSLILCCLLQKSCAGFGGSPGAVETHGEAACPHQGACPIPLCPGVTCPAWRGSPGGWALCCVMLSALFLLKNPTGLSSAGEMPPNVTFWDKGITGSLVPHTMAAGSR